MISLFFQVFSMQVLLPIIQNIEEMHMHAMAHECAFYDTQTLLSVYFIFLLFALRTLLFIFLSYIMLAVIILKGLIHSIVISAQLIFSKIRLSLSFSAMIHECASITRKHRFPFLSFPFFFGYDVVRFLFLV